MSTSSNIEKPQPIVVVVYWKIQENWSFVLLRWSKTSVENLIWFLTVGTSKSDVSIFQALVYSYSSSDRNTRKCLKVFSSSSSFAALFRLRPQETTISSMQKVLTWFILISEQWRNFPCFTICLRLLFHVWRRTKKNINKIYASVNQH